MAHELPTRSHLRTCWVLPSNRRRDIHAEIAILLPDSAGRLANRPHPVSTLELDQKELSVAAWAFEHSQPAGRYTDTLPTSPAQYLPLITPVAWLVSSACRCAMPEPPSVDQEALLQTFVSPHCAGRSKRELMNEATQRAAVAAESDKMYSTLLDSGLRGTPGASDRLSTRQRISFWTCVKRNAATHRRRWSRSCR